MIFECIPSLLPQQCSRTGSEVEADAGQAPPSSPPVSPRRPLWSSACRRLIYTLTHLGFHFPRLLSALRSAISSTRSYRSGASSPSAVSSFIAGSTLLSRPPPPPLIDGGVKHRGPRSEQRALDAESNLRANSADRRGRVQRADVAVITCGIGKVFHSPDKVRSFGIPPHRRRAD